jgi:hypothetical protein
VTAETVVPEEARAVEGKKKKNPLASINIVATAAWPKIHWQPL